MQQTLTAIFEIDEEGGYTAYVLEIPGVNTQGDTLEEAKTNLLEAFALMMEVRQEEVLHLKENNAVVESLELASA
ncbi:MAG: type II toxin-antitoxin system HicB family antitoxin [Verrucomicrobia bacterium]|nr:type II toxin-antitoxin system HicB family antitoxin [Cytophagales bacterium]